MKPRSKKCHVDSATHEQFMRGGEAREWLEIALSEALDKLGAEKNQHKKLRVPGYQVKINDYTRFYRYHC